MSSFSKTQYRVSFPGIKLRLYQGCVHIMQNVVFGVSVNISMEKWQLIQQKNDIIPIENMTNVNKAA